jgi:dTDP-4-amino-4,6-dideoxygalactose transaminase
MELFLQTFLIYKNTTPLNSSKIWLSTPHMGNNELKYIHIAFADNWVAPLGPHVNEFERRLAQYCHTKNAVALSSGTAAIHLALILLGAGRNDLILCQSNTFSATANPIVYQGATPVFIDSEKDTWNMCPESLEKAILDLDKNGKLPLVKAIMPVHLYGMAAQMKDIMAISQKYNIPVVEDAAEALGSTYLGEPCGSFGYFGVLSFNGNKIITTSGGGALLTNDSLHAKEATNLSQQARDEAPHYQHSKIGYNYRLSNIAASIGMGQMEVLSERVAKRRDNFARYQNWFQKKNEQGFNIQFQEEGPDYFSNRWLSCILIDPLTNNGLTREKIRLAMLEDNIESRPLWKPMHLQPIFSDAPYYGEQVAEKLFEEGLCLPSGSKLTEEEFERIFNKLEAIFSNP